MRIKQLILRFKRFIISNMGIDKTDLLQLPLSNFVAGVAYNLSITIIIPVENKVLESP